MTHCVWLPSAVSTVWFHDCGYSELVTPSGQKPGVVRIAHTLAFAFAACIADSYCRTSRRVLRWGRS